MEKLQTASSLEANHKEGIPKEMPKGQLILLRNGFRKALPNL